MDNNNLTHFNENGRSRMVDVSEKQDTERVAIAKGSIKMKPETIKMILEGNMKKGDVLAVAQVGGIMGLKRTSDIIPMCHNIFISGCDIEFEVKEDEVIATVTAKTYGKTGIEMEALTGVNICLLTIYDMCKAVDKSMRITDIRLVKKTGGKSGTIVNE